MARPQYNDPAYRREKERLRPIVEAGLAVCAELVCVMPSRRIPPGSHWALSHDHRDPSGATLLGPSHRRCNSAENAKRNQVWTKTRKASRRRAWVL